MNSIQIRYGYDSPAVQPSGHAESDASFGCSWMLLRELDRGACEVRFCLLRLNASHRDIHRISLLSSLIALILGVSVRPATP